MATNPSLFQYFSQAQRGRGLLENVFGPDFMQKQSYFTVDSATGITLEADCASVSAVNKDLYNISPITLILSFEK